MSGLVQLCSVSLFLLLSSSGSARGGALLLPDSVQHGPGSLNDMFREVEELMEDTQHILEEAVDQINTESAMSSITSPDRVLMHNQTRTLTSGNRVTPVLDQENLSHVHTEVSGPWNSPDHECMVDEDCGELMFCLYEMDSSKCLPCIPTDMPCTKDEECCLEQLCVWGQCTANSTRGTEGSICQSQSDCRAELCCAFQRELLYPVCNPKPGKGESCLNYPNLLMDMLAWDEDVPRDHCPCAQDLQCRPHGRRSVCG